MVEVISCQLNNKSVCNAIFKIRQQVFVNEQLVSEEEEFDSFESGSIHFLGSYNGVPAGTARWRITKNGIKLERFAVLPEFRKMGVAAAILKTVLSQVIPLNTLIYLHAQVSAMGFYERYGFKKEGSMFTEANIDHYKMYFDRNFLIDSSQNPLLKLPHP